MNKMVTIEIESTGNINHTLTVSVHSSVIKNVARLKSHCKSLVHKTYGSRVSFKRVRDENNNILCEV